MTQIEFVTGVANKVDYACRMIRKKLAQERRVVIYSTDSSLLAQLDKALWSFSALDFLPHVYAHDAKAAQTPVVLTHSSDQTPHEDILLNLDLASPPHFARFAQMVELVTTDENDVRAGRERYKNYRDHGYPLNHHTLNKSS